MINEVIDNLHPYCKHLQTDLEQHTFAQASVSQPRDDHKQHPSVVLQMFVMMMEILIVKMMMIKTVMIMIKTVMMMMTMMKR